MTEPAGNELPQNGNIPTPGDVASRINAANNVPTTQSAPDEYGLNPYLEKIPQAYRGSVEGVFKEYVDTQIAPLRDHFQQYEPYNDVLSQYQPDQLQQAVQYMELLENNPEGVLQALAAATGYELDDDEDDNSQIVQQGLENDPAYQQLQAQVAQMYELITGQQEEQLIAQEENEALNKVQNAFQKHGLDPNDADALDYVLAASISTDNPDAAAAKYKALTQRAAVQQNMPGQHAPVIMGAGGGQPVGQVDPAQWGSRDTESIVAQLLNAQKGQT